MAITLDITDDFSVVDNLESVTLTDLQSGGQTVDDCFSTPLKTREIEASNGRYTAGDRRFHLPTDNVTGKPCVGGTITDADYQYTILDVDHAVMSGIWKVTCRKLAITIEFDTAITIQLATWAKDANGVQAATWANEHTGVRAKIQPATEGIEQDENSRTIRKRYQVTFEDDQTLDHNRRIVGADGAIYKVLSYARRERIDVFPSALVELL